jgi:predicted P-loop ATPase
MKNKKTNGAMPKQKKSRGGMTKIKLIQEHLNNMNDYRYNVVTGNIEFTRKEGSAPEILNDYEVNSLARSLALSDLSYPVGSVRNLLKSDYVQKYDPFRAYLESLPEWDGTTDYILQLAETADTDNPGLWLISLRKWLTALAASLMDERTINHTMLVLTGKQGIGKTTWILNLVPDELKDYAYSGTINPDNKDAIIYLSECMLINLDELENLNKHQLGSIKELITKNQVRIRRPYGTIFENLPRRASFAGSVNSREFLTDMSGSRRFLCFEVSNIRYHNELSMDRVYAQALALYRSGFQFWFNAEEIEIINQNNEKFREVSLEEEQLFKYYRPCKRFEADEILKTSEILDIIFFNYKNMINNSSIQRLGRVLLSSGFLKIKRQGGQAYCLKRQGKNVDACPSECGGIADLQGIEGRVGNLFS